MRYFLMLIMLLAPMSCPAEEAPKAAPDATPAVSTQPASDGVQIINGKKFFPLSGARRQLNSDLSPSALAIINHPRADTRISPAFRARMNPRLASHEDSPPPRDTKVDAASMSDDEAILSIFTPDDRSLRSMPSNSASTIRK